MRLSRDALRAHLVDQLLPLWARHGLDRKNGGYWNHLAVMSPPPQDDDYKRLLVHARQVYVFSRAVDLGAGKWAADALAHGLAFLSRFWDRRHGGWFITTTDSGEPLDRRKDLYAHAFAIFALAEHNRVTGSAESLERARETWALVRKKLREPKTGGFHEGANEDWHPVDEPRRQNPHMHLFEALLALHSVAPDDGALDEAAALVELLSSRWLDPLTGALGEHFDARWQPVSGPRGQLVEPGHGFEWFALLHRFAALGGNKGALELADRLFSFAEKCGVSLDGGVYDQVNRAGIVVDNRQRLWPQTERLKALAIAGRRPELEAALERCAARYIDSNGGWREHLAADGHSLVQLQNATSVYHVVAAWDELLKVAD